jgi:hypothetical protein
MKNPGKFPYHLRFEDIRGDFTRFGREQKCSSGGKSYEKSDHFPGNPVKMIKASGFFTGIPG